MDQPSFLSGDSKMAEAIGRHEWSRSPLGPIDSWPETLKTTVALVLGSRFPAAIV